MGIKKKQDKLMDDLVTQFEKISKQHSLPPGDFPNIKRFRAILKNQELSKFPKLSEKMMKKLNTALSVKIPELMNLISSNDDMKCAIANAAPKAAEEENPFFQPVSLRIPVIV